MTEQPTTIVALVDDGPTTDPVVKRATELGFEHRARVVLYDVAATGGPLASPLPTEFASDGPDKGVPPLLTAQDLEAAGQANLARRVGALAEAGIDAYGWLPEGTDAEQLTEYAKAIGATRVVAGSGGKPAPDEIRGAGLDVEEVDTE
jgi:nucleotide-binding universal stress UspA family protein